MKAVKDLYNKIDVVHVLDAASQSAGVVKTQLIDTAKVSGVAFIINCGAYTVGSGSGVTFKLVEGDTAADASLTDVASGEYQASSLTLCTGTSDDQKSVKVGYLGTKRYVGVNITVSTSSTSCLLACDAIIGVAENEPVTASAAVART